jgi:2-oxoglutarate dehydrogenase E1 component
LAEKRAKDVRRLIFCTGKIAIDLLTSPHRQQTPAVAITRVEQLYPLPVRDILSAIEQYPSLEDVLWVQEEPENMGAWDFVRPALEGLVGTRRLAVLARPRSSSPAEGSAARHAQNQERLVLQAFDLKAPPSREASADRRSLGAGGRSSKSEVRPSTGSGRPEPVEGRS